MKRSTKARPHFERLLLVSGMPNAGKSNLLRGMFADPRFGKNGAIPAEAIIKLVALSRERCLSIRCTSPHEMGEDFRIFFGKLDRVMARAGERFWRFNFACAVQPREVKKMPGVVDICREFQTRMNPERIRIAQIDPRQDKEPGHLLKETEVDDLRRMGVELITLDAHKSPPRQRISNGILLADFFDFT
jgi:hypothetical protein